MIPENFHGFGNFFCFKIWMVLIFVVPLHSLSPKNLGGCTEERVL